LHGRDTTESIESPGLHSRQLRGIVWIAFYLPHVRSINITTQTRDEAMTNKVVAHYEDGRIIKGIGMDIDPARPVCHVRQEQGSATEVKLRELKALFFVRSLEGDPSRTERNTPDFQDSRTRGSSVVALRFRDGEEIVGITLRYPPIRPFFFVVPVDAESNNTRILVNRAAVVSMNEVAREQRRGVETPER
jgi:hypothetical protein